MKMLFNLAFIFFSTYLILVLLVFSFQHKLLYFPIVEKKFTETPGSLGYIFESVKIETEDHETLYGWFIPTPGAIGTVLFFHGNAGNISHRLAYLPMFQKLKLNLFLFDYRGYGQSSGTPSETGTYNDALATWDYLTETRDIPSTEIVLYGESLGGAIASWLATQRHSAMLILASTFTSIPELAQNIYPFLPARWIARFEYNTLANLKSIDLPVFIAHSPHDEIVPFSNGERLFQAANEPKQFLALANGHNDGFIFMREEWIDTLDVFIGAHLKTE